MGERVSIAGYGVLVAIVVWTLGWIAAASLSLEKVSHSGDVSSVLAAAVALTFSATGVWTTFRVLARAQATEPEKPTPKESWFRRVAGWCAVIAWCGVAIIWNVGVIGLVLVMAQAGRGWTMLILIPFSIIGWFLMIVLFVGLGVVIDSVIDLLRRTPGW